MAMTDTIRSAITAARRRNQTARPDGVTVLAAVGEVLRLVTPAPQETPPQMAELLAKIEKKHG